MRLINAETITHVPQENNAGADDDGYVEYTEYQGGGGSGGEAGELRTSLEGGAGVVHGHFDVTARLTPQLLPTHIYVNRPSSKTSLVEQHGLLSRGKDAVISQIKLKAPAVPPPSRLVTQQCLVSPFSRGRTT